MNKAGGGFNFNRELGSEVAAPIDGRRPTHPNEPRSLRCAGRGQFAVSGLGA